MKISIVKLGHEQCEQIKEFSLHNPTHKVDNYLMIATFVLLGRSILKNKAAEARLEYEHDVAVRPTPNKKFFSAELEKVIMLPHMDTFKRYVFTQRIISFSEAFAPLSSFTIRCFMAQRHIR